MPTYQYACTACGHQLEAVQSFAEDPLTECPACAGRLRKLYSSVGIVFKGSGFYRNDSRGSAGSAGEGSSGDGSKKAESPSSDSGTKADSPASTPAKATGDAKPKADAKPAA